MTQTDCYKLQLLKPQYLNTLPTIIVITRNLPLEHNHKDIQVFYFKDTHIRSVSEMII